MTTGEHERPPEPRGFGERLRAAREATGRSLDDLARTTRIRKAYLEALENEDWGRIPKGVIGRGFVRVVAKELGADEGEFTTLYRRARPDEAGEAAGGLPEPDWDVSLRGRRRKGVSPLAWAAVVLIVLLAGAGWWLWVRKGAPGPVSQEVPAQTERSPAPPVPPEPPPPGVPPASPEAAASAPAGPAAETPRAPEPPPPEPVPEPARPERLRLEITATEKAWIRVVADGGKPVDRVFQPGETRTYEASEGFLVKLGNAGGVRFSWNGEALKVPGRPGEVKEFRFPRDLGALRP